MFLFSLISITNRAIRFLPTFIQMLLLSAMLSLPICLATAVSQTTDPQITDTQKTDTEASATDNALQKMVDALGQGSFNNKSKAITALANMNEPRVAAILQAMLDGKLAVMKNNDQVIILGEKNSVINAITMQVIAGAKTADAKKITLNNRLRRDLSAVIGQLTLMNPDAEVRLQAAQTMLRSRDEENLSVLKKAIEVEKDSKILLVLQQAQASTILATDKASEADKINAIAIVATLPPRDAMSILTPYAPLDGSVGEAANNNIKSIEHKLQFQAAGQNIVYGLSLGSVLLLAAIGLAITFGVMGVINMAHGEMVMIGTYTTFVVQSTIAQVAPALQSWSLLIALPIAFLLPGGIGVLLERTVIRWLYGRTLETLLATWGVSLLLQQGIRSIFGASNREVSSPFWMSGSYELLGIGITASRLWIIIFALAIFVFLLFFMKRSFFGLQMRAVTQNRKMANAMGIRSPYIDALTFGLGSGIAGLAGVALSQIDNVSPNLGQNYIIDSFMVVVFGGVGNLWGTLVAAMSLGVANKLLEPFAGAVLGKILLLVFIILFIQKRPRGLFSIKGRSVEA